MSCPRQQGSAALCRSAADFEDAEPWDALEGWLRRFVGYMATKKALAHELLDYVSLDAPLFMTCRASIQTAGKPLLERAQRAGVVRPDADLAEIIQMVGGIAKIPGAGTEQIDRILRIALDGLRYQALVSSR